MSPFDTTQVLFLLPCKFGWASTQDDTGVTFLKGSLAIFPNPWA